MSHQQLFIPDQLRVGYQKREGTYTGNLAYIVYYDTRGKLRKAASWESWRDKGIEPQEFPNTPTEGFVLNKGVGGVRQSYGWNARNEYIRIYDPRDFEFEISVANLLFILHYGDCSRGKGLEGNFVYAWDGAELVLLPEGCPEYQASRQFTGLQGQKVSARSLVEGYTYNTRKQQSLVYLGRRDCYFGYLPGYGDKYDERLKSGTAKRHVFWAPRTVEKDGTLVYLKDASSLAAVQSDTLHPNYAELVAKFYACPHGSPVKRLYLQPGEIPVVKEYTYSHRIKKGWYEPRPGRFMYYTGNWGQAHYDPTNPHTIREYYLQRVYLQDTFYRREDGILVQERGSRQRLMNNPRYQAYLDKQTVTAFSRPYNYGGYGGRSYPEPQTLPWQEPTWDQLWVELESGATLPFNVDDFGKI